MMRGSRIALLAVGVVLFTGAVFAAGVHAAGAMQALRHPALLTGADWSAFSFREKEVYLSGFIAGAAAEQVRALAQARGSASDSAAVSSGAIDSLRRASQLRYSYAPSVYAAQLDDFYWWRDHIDTPIVDVMIAINARMKDAR